MSGGDTAPDFSEPTFFFLPTLLKVWVEANDSREETVTAVGTLRSSWAVRPARPSSSSSSSSTGGGPPFLLPLPPFAAFLCGWTPPPAAWTPAGGRTTFVPLLLFQAEMRLVGAALGLEVEDTRAGKSSSWKALLPLEGTAHARASPTGPRAAAEGQEEDVEARRLGKSSSLSSEVGGGTVLSPERGERSAACRALTCPEPTLCGSPTPTPVRAPTYLRAAPAAWPGAGGASWLTGPSVRTSLGPTRKASTSGRGQALVSRPLGSSCGWGLCRSPAVASGTPLPPRWLLGQRGAACGRAGSPGASP